MPTAEAKTTAVILDIDGMLKGSAEIVDGKVTLDPEGPQFDKEYTVEYANYTTAQSLYGTSNFC